MKLPSSPKGWAIHLSKLVKLFHEAHGLDRFPIKVAPLAMEYSRQVFPDASITLVEGIALSSQFDGMLMPSPRGEGEWGIVYNNAIQSPGRINFTLAHELGHYLLHRHVSPAGKVHGILQQSPRLRASNTRSQTPALLKGIIFTETGSAMTPTATKKGSRLYRYYTSMDLIRNRATGEGAGPLRLPAGMVEDVVIGEIRRMVRAPEIAARTIEAFRRENATVDEQAIVSALAGFDQLWAALFPAEQARIVHLLVDRVSVGTSGIAVDLRNDGLGSVVRDMLMPRHQEARA